MQLGKSVLIATILSLLYISPSNSHNTKPLDTWLKFCPTSQLCFERPKNLKPINLPMIDSISGQLNNENMILFYDLGRYSSTFRELSSASSELVKIDGYQGEILIQKNKMALTIANISGKAGFSMLIEFKNTVDLEQGRRIFNSLKFNLIQ